MSSYDDAIALLCSRMDAVNNRIAPVNRGVAALETQTQTFKQFIDNQRFWNQWPLVIHIAGSKGKGSTALFAESMLQQAGFRTGLFTSPHLHSWRERIAINQQPISAEEFTVLMQQAIKAESAWNNIHGPLVLNAFQLLTFMSLAHFARQRCDVLVVEVGLGGRYDPTSVVEPTVSVITRLELEHTDILGQTIEEIAWNKAGIIRQNIPVVSCRQTTTAEQVLATICKRQDAPLLMEDREWSWSGSWRQFSYRDRKISVDSLAIPIPGSHQIQNASMAITALDQLQSQDGGVGEKAIRTGLALTRLPGRYERVTQDGREFIIDAAHTPESASQLTWTLQTEHQQQADVILGMFQDKDIIGLLNALKPIARSIIVVPPQSARAADPKEMSRLSASIGVSATIASSLQDAINHLSHQDQSTRPVVITGSMRMAAEARELFVPDSAMQSNHCNR